MANLSDKTRKEQVLAHLQARKDQWVDGPEIQNEQVGGSEGHRRLRELRMDGHRIETRKHPDPERDIWQYRYVDTPEVMPRGAGPASDRGGPATSSDADQPRSPTVKKYSSPPTKLAFGEAIPCPGCQGKKRRIDPNDRKMGPCTRCNAFGIVPV